MSLIHRMSPWERPIDEVPKTKEPTASAPSAMKIKVVAPPERERVLGAHDERIDGVASAHNEDQGGCLTSVKVPRLKGLSCSS